MKFSFLLLAINILISFLYNLVSKHNSFGFINCSFTIGMIYFLSGSLFYVWEKGFFNITLFSFKKIHIQMQKRRGLIFDDYNINLDDYLYRKNNFFLTKYLLSCGSTISCLCIIISFLFI